MIPGLSAALGFKYQWNFETQPITSLKDNGTFQVPSPKLVGGDSATNSMSQDRGSKQDYDSWASLGAKGWGWDDLLPYFRKSETFHPPNKNQQSEFGIRYDPAAHGTNGPVQVKFASYIFPQYSKCFLGIAFELSA
jgi:choline dehydrogenase-like flavoprotein